MKAKRIIPVLSLLACLHGFALAELDTHTKDLTTPVVETGEPASGKRVRMTLPSYLTTSVHHTLYLPTDWKEGERYPVIVEYAGNRWKTSPGTVGGSNLGYGISGGKGVIWMCLPFVDRRNKTNAKTWWGDVDATVEYCKEAVEWVCENYGGDESNVFIAGFSRGSIACNYIGLHDDEIAKLWKGFICHSHYDGVRKWGYEGDGREAAMDRLKRLDGRPQFISHERSVEATENYLKSASPSGDFTFLALPFADHTDAWVLHDIKERKVLRDWFASAMLIKQVGGEAGTLQEVFKDDFLIGAALKEPVFDEDPRSTLDMVARQFGSVSSCNMLKWQPFNPRPGKYRHELADAFVEFGVKNQLFVHGHVLFWHNQTPQWVFRGKNGAQVSRDELLKRMRQRVEYVAERYGKKIDAWDVVNESFLSDGGLRDSQWTRIIGNDFIEQAFRIANEELPAEVELVYNDYSMTEEKKRDAVVGMVRDLKQKGIRIDGVGMQGHWGIDGPPVSEIEASIIAFHEAGVDVYISELDIDVLPRKKGIWDADIAKRLEGDDSMDPYREGLPDDMQQKLADRYAELFRLFLKHKDKIRKVTFWGTTDKYSWLNDWPIKGRTNYPLLFGRDGKPKPAFDEVIGLKSGD